MQHEKNQVSLDEGETIFTIKALNPFSAFVPLTSNIKHTVKIKQKASEKKKTSATLPSSGEVYQIIYLVILLWVYTQMSNMLA